MRFDPVLFDLDGTLIDSGSLILASFQHATQTVLGRVIPDEVLMANVGGHGIHAQMREFDPERADELVRVYREHHNTVDGYRSIELFPGIEDLLRRLNNEGRALGVVTAKGRLALGVLVEVLPILHYFGAVVTGDDTEQHKPDPQPLLRALERLGASAASAAYVGDSPFDIRAAQSAGVVAVAVGWGKIHPIERLEAERPDYVVRIPAELADVL